MRILFVTATRIGDAVLTTGLLAHLLERHPGARLIVACGPAAAPLFAAVPGLERIVVLRKKPFGGHWLRLWAMAAPRYWHLVVDLRGSALAWLVPAGRRLVRRPDDRPIHRVRSYGALVGAEESPPAPRLWIAPADEREAARLLPEGSEALALGPAAGWHAKRWPAARFAALARRLTAPEGVMPGARIVVLGGSADRAETRPLVAALPGCIDLVGSAALLPTAALLRRCRLFVGNDSGLMHLAAAAGAPTLGLFGPSRESLYGPWGAHGASVRTPLSFEALVGGPGYDRRTTGCLMEGLTVDMAEEAARALWDRSGGARASARICAA